MLAPPLYSQQLYAFCFPPAIVMDEMSLYYLVKAQSQHTIGVEFSSRTVKLGEKRIKLQVCSYTWIPVSLWAQHAISFGILRDKNDSGLWGITLESELSS